jgi:hypothetical protein
MVKEGEESSFSGLGSGEIRLSDPVAFGVSAGISLSVLCGAVRGIYKLYR